MTLCCVSDRGGRRADAIVLHDLLHLLRQLKRLVEEQVVLRGPVRAEVAGDT